MLAESLLLAVFGGALGLATSAWLTQVLSAWMPALEFPVKAEFTTDWRVVAFAAFISLTSVVLSGVLPALRTTAVDLAPALRNELPFQRFRRFELRDLFVAVQVALSVVLLAGSILMVRQLQKSLSQHFGFEPDGAVVVRFDLGMQGYTEERGREFQRALLERVRTLPGIDAAGLANSIPFSIDQSTSGVYVEGEPVPPRSRAPSAFVYEASPGFVAALGARLLMGRDFNERDRAGSPLVAIVNKTFADTLIAGKLPIGRRFGFGQGGVLLEIVGVVEAGRYQTVTEDLKPAVWRPLAQGYNGTSTLVARTRLDEEEAVATLQRAVAELDQELPVYDAKTLRRYLDLPLTPLRLTTALLTATGTLAVFLSALGLYGLLAYSTAQRTRELGIRMALGARPIEIVRLVLTRTAVVVGVSATAGLVLSLVTTRLLAGLLYAAVDVSVYALASFLIAFVAAVACLVPARRAMRIQPSSALRFE